MENIYINIFQIEQDYIFQNIEQSKKNKKLDENTINAIINTLKKKKTSTDEVDKNVISLENIGNYSIASTSSFLNNSFNSYLLNNFINNSYFSEILNSTRDNTKSLIISNNTSIINNKEAQFNSLRVQFYLKYNLFDICLYEMHDITNSPVKYKINCELSAFLYPNEIITFCLTISGFLKKENIKIFPNIPKIEVDHFNTLLGLRFCNKIIEIETDNGIQRKKCSPFQFLCKNCNEINKKIYGIKKQYLININGRVAKINKGKYHCFGHFLCKNQIEDCITNFCCKACEMLNLFSKYYQQK